MNVLETNVSPDTEISGIFYDSRKVEQGSLFVAITGFAADGNRFIPMALSKGAAAVVTAKKPQGDVPYILVDNDRLALAMLGVNWHGRPAESMKIIGVTGTNGKTSTTLLLKQVLETCRGAKVGLIGTMSNLIGDEEIPTERTTPESLDLQALFARMRSAGCTHVVMEVSSHALTLDRVGGIRFDVAAFTNLTEDHLDFHKTMDAYCDAKAELFARCDKAVINMDDSYAPRMLEKAKCHVLKLSCHEGDLLAKDAVLHAEGVAFTAVCGGKEVPVRLPIPGKFTVYNALGVMGIALQLGIGLEESAAALRNAQGVKGRMEVVPTPGKDYSVLIDYSHTPDALENVISSVQDFCRGRVITVFGCGGDRDPIKRPIMGRIGAEIADIAIITSDNPRTEEPAKIIEDIVAGIDSSKNNYEIIENRPKAIRHAMDKIGRAHV